jgi:hypothetical protein
VGIREKKEAKLFSEIITFTSKISMCASPKKKRSVCVKSENMVSGNRASP